MGVGVKSTLRGASGISVAGVIVIVVVLVFTWLLGVVCRRRRGQFGRV